MSAEKIDVHYVAKLARIELSDSEAEAFSSQLADVVAHVQELNEVDLSKADSLIEQQGAGENHLREDEPFPGLPRDPVLANAPESSEGEIVMPKIVE
ncbi:MAG: Asp-tRNA(Asn)/Glu-tRNA(Gln) amidotransferase subunit GatC [Verrucomicrobiota bacterium]